MGRPKKPADTSFFEKINKTSNQLGCWEWIAAKNRQGYGVMKVNGSFCMAHRFSYELHNNVKIESGISMIICHKCDNPSCVNPDHLFLGTHKDNMQDMLSKGRGSLKRKTHCKYGHELTPSNRITNGACRTCSKILKKRLREARKAQTLANLFG